MDKLKLIEAILESSCSTPAECPFKIGEAIFVRTVTHYMTGRIKSICGKFITLTDAAWIADSGRFMQAIKDGTLSEVEPVFVDVRLNSDTFIDVYGWKHTLPREQK